MGTLLSLYRPLRTDSLLAKRRRAEYVGTGGPGGSPTGLRMQPRNEQFFTFFGKAGSNVVESAAIFMEFVAAPHERWAERSGPCIRPLRATTARPPRSC